MESVFQYLSVIFNHPLLTINQTPITLASLFIFTVTLLVFVVLARLAARTLVARVLTRFKVEEGIAYNLERVTYYLLVIIGTVVAFQFIGIDLSGLTVIFGLLSVGIGFGLQNVTSNFISGLILLFERPIKVGDRVTVGETEGDVIEINIRSTTIRSLNNISIIVPNSEFVSSRVVNWSHGDKRVRISLPVGVSYGSDLDAVLESLREVADENPDVMKQPSPEVLFIDFGDSSWNMQLRCWIPDPKKHWAVQSALNCAIVRKFRERGVEIPFPQRDFHLRSAIPVAVRTEPSDEAGTPVIP